MIALWVVDKRWNVVARRSVKLSDNSQHFWHAACGRHFRYMQPESVRRALDRPGSNGTLACFICDALKTHMSKHVPQVQAAAEGSGQQWVAEVHCLQEALPILLTEVRRPLHAVSAC